MTLERSSSNLCAISLAAAASAVFIYMAVHFGSMSYYMIHCTYYIIFALVLFWAYYSFLYADEVNFSLRSFIAAYYPGIILSLLLVAAIFTSVEPALKTFNAEPQTLLMSKAMFYKREVIIGAQSPDLRPYLLPFLVGLLHSLRGYNLSNIFILNAGLMFLLFLGSYVWATQLLRNRKSGLAGPLLVAASPVLAIQGTSGEVDMFAALMLGAVLLSTSIFMARRTPAAFGWLWVNMLLFAHVREESFIFMPVIIGFLVLFRYMKREHLVENKILLAATPFLILPIVFQRLLTWGHNYGQPLGEPIPIQTHYFGANFRGFIVNQLNLKFNLPYPSLLHLIAFFILIYLAFDIVVLKRVFREPRHRHFFTIFCCCVALNVGIYLSLWAPNVYSHPGCVRHFIFYSMICSLSPVVGLVLWSKHQDRRWNFLLPLLSAAMFFLYHPFAVEKLYFGPIQDYSEANYAYEILDRQPDKKILVLSSRHWDISAAGYRAASVEWANAHPYDAWQEIRRHVVRDIIVIQRINYLTEHPDSGDSLDPAFTLQILAESQTSKDRFMRISRIVDFKPSSSLRRQKSPALR